MARGRDSRPYMPWFVGDYLADTRDLTAEEHGAYMLLLGTMWMAGGRLPADQDRLRRFAAVEADRWPAVWATVSRFFEEADGWLTQARLQRELDYLNGKAEAGRKGGLVSGEVRKTEAPREANGEAKPEATKEANGKQNPKPHPIPSHPRDPDPPLPPDGGSRAGPGSLTPAARWLEAFKLAWRDRPRDAETRGPAFYGAPGDTQAVVKLDEFFEREPQVLKAAEPRRAELFAAFFADADPRVRGAGHPFAFFVGRLHGYLANLPDRAPNGEQPRRRNPERPKDVATAEQIRAIREGRST